MSYDIKCSHLAEYFLGDLKKYFTSTVYKRRVEHLAQVIQDSIEQEVESFTHDHRCQQCETVVKAGCTCDGEMMWCSANCRAAFDL